ncbi:uncharacterized protein [Antedon mediterranea]|uniref:uncharacterized protein n=1 Tax=Antedon mediterranea TaxID=105859 RepID=UPI003AF99AB3
MFPKTITKEKKTNVDETQVNIEKKPIVKKKASLKKKVIVISLVLFFLVCGVVTAIMLTMGTGWCGTVDYIDDGISHSMDVYTYPSHHVEIVIFEQIANVTDGGTLIFDFYHKIIAAYSAQNSACYLWADENLNWHNRDWLYNGNFPSFNVERQDIISPEYLTGLASEEIVDQCCGMTTYWSIKTTELNGNIGIRFSENPRNNGTVVCSFNWKVCTCQ